MSLSSRHESSCYFSLCCFKHIFTLVSRSRSSSLLFALCSLTPSLQADRFIHEVVVLLFSSTVFLKLFTFFDRSLFFLFMTFISSVLLSFLLIFCFLHLFIWQPFLFPFYPFIFLMVILHFLLFFRFFFLFFSSTVLLLVFLYVYCTCTLWFVELPCAFSMTCVM